MLVELKSKKRKFGKGILRKSKGVPATTVVAIGASAGGLDAVSELIKNLPPDTGMAFFYIQHLSPTHTSELGVLLARSTEMKVKDVRNLQVIEKNCLYVCVPNYEMHIRRGKIRLTARPTNILPYLPINDFFSSVAENYGSSAVGVILSGNATDGTLGLNAIKAAGGVTFAQDKSAKYDSMPRSAVDSGIADYVLPPDQIAKELVLLSATVLQDAKNTQQKNENHTSKDSGLNAILGILHKKTGVDFSHYKLSTITRRLNYRMLHCGIQTLKKYLIHLQKNNLEADLLQKDFLIHVTSFFRDEKAFKYLKRKVLPRLLDGKSGNEALRIWVPGCATGEEAYSIAMLIAEIQEEKGIKIPVQIFATDLSNEAVKHARLGGYNTSAMAAVSKDRLKRFFLKSGKSYRVTKTLREWCVFAPHNVLSDPPFSRIDLICCCNLLIYLDAAAQKRVLSTFNFSLTSNGYLMLGKSETVGNSLLFSSSVSNTLKIYVKKQTTEPRHVPALRAMSPGIQFSGRKPEVKAQVAGNGLPLSTEDSDLDGLIDTTLLSSHMPACVVINKELKILKFRGATSPFLTHAPGAANLNILKMSPSEFSIELRSAINNVFVNKQVVRCPEVDLSVGGVSKTLSIEVHPLKGDNDELLILIVFTAVSNAGGVDSKSNGSDHNSIPHNVGALKDKLAHTRKEMRQIIDAHENAYEALQDANEQIVSSNEEFQTLNEELETSKEEIEATNEELLSINQELLIRNDLLTESYKYSEAIIATVHEPMLVLDSNLHVKSANNSFYRKFLVSKDQTIGVSVFELGNGQWNLVKLRKLLKEIITENISFKNLEITHSFPGLGVRIMQLNAHRVIQKTHKERLILLAIEDITERARHFLKEKENLKRDIVGHKADKDRLEKAVKLRTKELEENNLELATANKDLTSFTYVSSHDLQEPLRKIRNFIAVLMEEEQARLSHDGKLYLERTYDTAKRMQLLIDDLLMYSRAKNTERKFEKTSLKKIIEEVRKDLEELVRESKATIKTFRLGDVIVIPSQFKQLFQNLISNAIKYSKPDIPPVITIKSNVVHSRRIKHLQPASDIEYCHISVSDNGIGFDPQYSERIFEVFQRLHSPETFAGTGMGLAICKRIVENHDGIIRATSEVDKGSTFDVYIPLFRISG